MPIEDRTFWPARSTTLSDRVEVQPSSQPAGAAKTTTSPCSGSPNRSLILSTKIRSPVQPSQPTSVGSIDSDGIW
jgi:hypothetical protein